MLYEAEKKTTNRITIDYSAPVCPVCGRHPMVVERIFDIKQMLVAQEMRRASKRHRPMKKVVCKKAKDKYVYYHCECGECTTDWYCAKTNRKGEVVTSAADLAREAYINGQYVGSKDNFSKHKIYMGAYRKTKRLIAKSEAAMKEQN